MSVKSKIQALLSAINTKTGHSDSDLTEAVQTLCDGYGQGGSEPVLVQKTVTPALTDEIYTPDDGEDGFSSVKVNKITSSLLNTLDNDFVAANIKKDVELFGTTGTYEGSGGLNDLNLYAKSLYSTFSGTTDLPDTLVINAPNCTTMRETFSNIRYESDMEVRPAREIFVKAGTLTALRAYVVGGGGTQTNNTSTQIFHLDCEFDKCNFDQAFRLASALREIDCELDFTDATSVNIMFSGASALREVRFKSKSLALDISLSNSRYLTDESLVSIANGLDPAAAKTLTLHADSLARCGEIMGTVVGDTFTADENGTVALDDFITDTKGWTLSA